MSDDTATMERLRIVPGKGGKGFAYSINGNYPIEGPGDGSRFETEREARYAAELEQQARTIAELREHKSESEDIIAGLRLELLGAERAQEWTREDRVAAEKTIAEQAARLEATVTELEWARKYVYYHLRSPDKRGMQIGSVPTVYLEDLARLDAAIDGAKT